MSRTPELSVIALLVELGIIVLILDGVIVLTYRFSGHLNRVSLPGTGALLSWSFLPLLMGAGVVWLLRARGAGPIVGLGSGLAVVVLMCLPALKLAVGSGWKIILRLWGTAAAMQILVLPLCLVPLLFAAAALLLSLFPPVY
jgi:hypothetical protein